MLSAEPIRAGVRGIVRVPASFASQVLRARESDLAFLPNDARDSDSHRSDRRREIPEKIDGGLEACPQSSVTFSQCLQIYRLVSGSIPMANDPNNLVEEIVV